MMSSATSLMGCLRCVAKFQGGAATLLACRGQSRDVMSFGVGGARLIQVAQRHEIRRQQI